MRLDQRLLLCAWLFALALAAIPASTSSPTATSFEVVNLRTEYLESPLGVDVAAPRLSWQIRPKEDTKRRGVQQLSSRVLVWTDQIYALEHFLFDCGTLLSSETSMVLDQCHGSKRGDGNQLLQLQLESDTIYHWQVTVTLDDHSTAVGTSTFHTGLLSPVDWEAEWITGGDENNLIRREFEAPKEFGEHATIFVSGIGYHELYLNGGKVGDHQLDQGWTDYEKRVWYSTHDVTLLIKPGEANVIGVMMGNGWWSCGVPPGSGMPNCADAPPQLLLQLNVNGKPLITTHTYHPGPHAWRVAPGPIHYNSLYNGEVFDARVAETLEGWTSPGFDAAHWARAEPASSVADQVIRSSQLFEPIRHISTRPPIAITKSPTGVQVFDFGQNQAAVVRLKDIHCQRGTNITIRHAELLTHPPYGDADGSLYVTNLRSARATDVYICRGGDSPESYIPTFTQHGFRYAEVSGLDYALTKENIEAVELHSDVQPTSTLNFSSPLLNDIQHMVLWSQKTNLMSVPTDCDQRDERRGWMGDAALTAEEAVHNYAMGAFYSRWLLQITDAQSDDGSVPDFVPGLNQKRSRQGAPNWASAFPTILWTLHRYYGDVHAIVRFHDPLVRYFDFFERVYNQTGLANFCVGACFGDWVPPPPHPKSNHHLTAAFAFLHDLRLGVDLFSASSHPGAAVQAKRCTGLVQKLSSEFHAAFYNATIGMYGSGLQTEAALPLFLESVVPPSMDKDVLAHLVHDIVITNSNHTTSGIVGIKFAMEALSMLDRTDVALDLALQTTYPSWGYMLHSKTEPATTVWELWNSDTGPPEMNSRNHIMFGSVSSWFYKFLAGISATKPGYSEIRIEPHVPSKNLLTHLDATVVTPHGDVVSNWKLEHQDDNAASLTPPRYTHKVSIPPNTRATLFLPVAFNGAGFEEFITIQEGGVTVWANGSFLGDAVNGIKSAIIMDDKATVEFLLGSGDYLFTASMTVTKFGLSKDNSEVPSSVLLRGA